MSDNDMRDIFRETLRELEAMQEGLAKETQTPEIQTAAAAVVEARAALKRLLSALSEFQTATEELLQSGCPKSENPLH